MKEFNRLLAAFLVLGSISVAVAQTPPPKYGPHAIRLARAHDYVCRHEAPDFWALMPYYLPQPNDSSCSAASIAMVVNALRAGQDLAADEELATVEGVVEKVGDAGWRKAVAPGGEGVSLERLGRLAEAALKAYGRADVRVTLVPAAAGEEFRRTLRAALIENERSAGDFILVNFQQNVFTGDPQGAIGHIAPLAAFDAERDRALVLDPDRRWYEPYWVSLDTLQAGMTVIDPISHQPRGYIQIRHK
jgi:glutathione-S-conjugate glycine hydrolase